MTPPPENLDSDLKRFGEYLADTIETSLGKRLDTIEQRLDTLENQLGDTIAAIKEVLESQVENSKQQIELDRILAARSFTVETLLSLSIESSSKAQIERIASRWENALELAETLDLDPSTKKIAVNHHEQLKKTLYSFIR